LDLLNSQRPARPILDSPEAGGATGGAGIVDAWQVRTGLDPLEAGAATEVFGGLPGSPAAPDGGAPLAAAHRALLFERTLGKHGGLLSGPNLGNRR
jgi:hypothetical protein